MHLKECGSWEWLSMAFHGFMFFFLGPEWPSVPCDIHVDSCCPCQTSTLFDISPIFECCIHTHPQLIIVNACKCLIPSTLNLQWASLFQFEILEATGTSEPCASRGAGQVWSPSSKLVYSPWCYSYIHHKSNSQPFFLQFAATWLSKSDENLMTSQFLLVK